jgi:hypothetical protein
MKKFQVAKMTAVATTIATVDVVRLFHRLQEMNVGHKQRLTYAVDNKLHFLLHHLPQLQVVIVVM